QEGDSIGAARLYLSAAQQARDEERISLFLHGLELLLDEPPTPEDADLASRTLDELGAMDLDATQRTRANVAAALLALWNDDPYRAMAMLPEELEGRPAPLARRILETRIKVLAYMEDWLAVVLTRISLERWQADPQGIEANRMALWNSLLGLDQERLGELELRAPDSTSAGWLGLAQVARSTSPRPADLETALEDWMLRYPVHPGTREFLPMLRQQWAELGRYPERIAGLLPMTGRLGTVSMAIYEGLMASYYRLPIEDRPSLRLYDSGEQAEATWTLYQQAVQDGATLVIGPLDRRAVELFVRSDDLPVPMLALNQVPSDEPPPAGLYQYGLNPEDEAHQVAEHAAIEGHLQALVLAPRNELGERLSASFAARFQELGGMTLAAQFYAPQATDYATSITQGLGVNDSQGRHRQLQNILRQNVEFEPRRRQDLDLVFMVGSPREARLLAPQLAYHRAGDLPILSTSHAYSGQPDSQADADLDGVILADIPWILDVPVEGAPTRASLTQALSPGSRQLPRLVAMGYDAFQLAPLLSHLHQRPGERLPGLTGNLYLDTEGRIHRHLHWAVFRQGTLRPMAPPAPTRPAPLEGDQTAR
ncbi:MAG TPA: penicillin-binding protein activator, partial [Thioalkalivibrio sp.]|nr:penicillin-binding protein activator [Thioalkalivibrio sp.]